MSPRVLIRCLLAVAGLFTAMPLYASDFRVHGLLDLVAAQRSDTYQLNRLTRGDSQYDPYGLRLFLDGNVNDRLDVFGQVVLRDGANPYVDGAYVSFTPFSGHDTHLLAGKIPWPVGTYGPRTYSNKNPLIATPLMYQYHTTLLWWAIPPSADVLIANSGNGQYNIDYFGFPMGMGMPVVDDSWWDVGVTAVGSQGPLEYSMGIMAGTPGWGNTVEDENTGKTILGRLGLVPAPGLRFGVSGALGPYLIEDLNGQLAPGQNVNEFRQKIGMVDVEFATGHLELRAEGAWNTWQTPTVGDLDVATGYVEMKYALSFGAFIAGRLDGMRFSDIADSTGVEHTWDSNISRWELGAGYRFDRNILAKLVYQHTTMEGRDLEPSLLAAQLGVGF